MKSRFSIFTWLLGLAMVVASVEHASAAVYTVTNNQAVGATLGLNPLTTYTHKLDFPGDGNSTAINGVQFSAVAGGAGVDPLTGRAYSLTMANPSLFNNGSFGVVDDFIHNGGQPANAVETLTLGGLTAGTVYDARLYYRNFGARPNTVTVNTGAAAPWVGVLDQATASNENYQSIVFQADGATATLTFAQNVANASWHQYAVSTQLVANPSATRAIHGLFPTGVDALGVTLANGAADPHYSFISGPQVPGTNPQAMVQANNGAWSANNPTSKWIGVTASGGDNVAPGTYLYSTTFNIASDADLATAVLNGIWWADNGDLTNTQILLNGVNTLENGNIPFAGAGPPFSIAQGDGGSTFLRGLNTLTFQVFNPGGANPHGLRVDSFSGSFQAANVPEPSSIAMWSVLGLIGAACARRFRRRQR